MGVCFSVWSIRNTRVNQKQFYVRNMFWTKTETASVQHELTCILWQDADFFKILCWFVCVCVCGGGGDASKLSVPFQTQLGWIKQSAQYKGPSSYTHLKTHYSSCFLLFWCMQLIAHKECQLQDNLVIITKLPISHKLKYSKLDNMTTNRRTD